MLLLAIDTCTATASAALFDGERVVGELTWLAGREHSTHLFGGVQYLLDLAGARTSDLTGLGVARGPGSFTGVRVGLGAAKGMALGLGIPLWGVNALDAAALAAAPGRLALRVVLQVGRGRVATAAYRDGEQTDPPRIVAESEIPGLMEPEALLAGELSPTLRALMVGREGGAVVSVSAGVRRASCVAELAWRAAVGGEDGDPSRVDALYLAPAAQPPKRR